MITIELKKLNRFDKFLWGFDCFRYRIEMWWIILRSPLSDDESSGDYEWDREYLEMFWRGL